MRKCLIFCAAEFDALAVPIGEGDFLLAADGGLRHLQKLNLSPHGIIGDFDSLGYTPTGAEVFHPVRSGRFPCRNAGNLSGTDG